MKKAIILLFVVLCSGLYAQKDKSYHSHRHEPGIDDFKSQTADFKYSEKGMFYYCISNDKENIYLNLRIYNSDVQRQVLNSGITVWINTDGKKSRKLGVKYPARLKGNETGIRPGNQSMQQRGAVPGERGNMPDMNTGSIQLIGFSESSPQTISATERDNFRGTLKIEKDRNMYYEIILPFSKMPVIDDQPQGKKKVGSFILGIAYPSVSSMSGPPGGGQGMPSGGGPGGGGMPGGGGGMPGGGGGRAGGGPGGGAGPPSQGSSSSSQSIFWIKDIRLAMDK